ncbi:PAS domain-containing protein [Lacipirellula sp.]|uniref:PAS domain-containing protein n=1 Tax=Lacipirellula sp. TaxID=2691419 RepID=UPI003D14D220
MKTLREAIDCPMPISHRARGLFAMIYFSVGAILAFLAYENAAQRAFRIEAGGRKQQALKAVDASLDFGRVILDSNGRILSWNRGMTELTGRTSQEMVGRPIADIADNDADTREMIIRLISAAEGASFANLELPRANAHPEAKTLVRMQIRTVSGQPGTYRFVAVDPIGQINAVTP